MHKTTLPLDFYKPDNNFIHYLAAEDVQYKDAREFIHHVAANWRNIDSLNPSKGPVVLEFPVDKDSNQSFTWTLTKNFYLQKDDIIFTDLFSCNAFRRPIQFFYVSFDLDDQCRLRGLTYRVFPSLTETERDSVDLANVDYFYHRFHYTTLDSLSQRNTTILDHISYYSGGFATTAQNLIAIHKDQLAVNVLDKYFSLFPDNLIHFDFRTFYVAQSYYYAGAYSKGDHWMLALATRLRKNLSEALTDKKHNIRVIDDNLEAMNNIMALIDQFKRPDPVRANIKKISESMEKDYNKLQ